MAAIIAQLTLNARRRKQRSKGYLSADKCNYILRPFDKCYVPEKHNHHLRNEKLYEKNKQGRETAKGIDYIKSCFVNYKVHTFSQQVLTIATLLINARI